MMVRRRRTAAQQRRDAPNARALREGPIRCAALDDANEHRINKQTIASLTYKRQRDSNNWEHTKRGADVDNDLSHKHNYCT